MAAMVLIAAILIRASSYELCPTTRNASAMRLPFSNP